MRFTAQCCCCVAKHNLNSSKSNLKLLIHSGSSSNTILAGPSRSLKGRQTSLDLWSLSFPNYLFIYFFKLEIKSVVGDLPRFGSPHPSSCLSGISVCFWSFRATRSFGWGFFFFFFWLLGWKRNFKCPLVLRCPKPRLVLPLFSLCAVFIGATSCSPPPAFLLPGSHSLLFG